ncbi:MAG: winged helix-turn-helix domain-containing protein [Halobacteriaceae archaeon]
MSATDTRPTDADEPTDLDAIRDLPPSAKLVAKVLEYDGTLTQSQLAEETLLPARTVRYALSRLEETGVVESRFSFSDARKRLYTLTVETR